MEENLHIDDVILDGALVEGADPHQVEMRHEESKLPQLDTTSFPSQLFWLTVTFVALYLLMARSVLPRIHEVLEKRQHRLTQDLTRAEDLSTEAAEAKASYEQLQEDAKTKAQKLIAEAQHAINEMRDSKFAELDKELADKMTKAQKAIAKKQDDVTAKLEPVANELAADIAARIAGKKPTEKQVAKAVTDATKS